MGSKTEFLKNQIYSATGKDISAANSIEYDSDLSTANKAEIYIITYPDGKQLAFNSNTGKFNEISK